MKQFAVIGNPIAHSRSPELHQSFAAQTGIALQYERILAPLDEFETVVKAFFDKGGSGLNVTVPFKEQAFALCDQLTERARIAQAVNTLWWQDDQLHGDNTDGPGLVAALQAHGVALAGRRVLILGAGGATRGVIYPLAMAGVAQIVIANRTLPRAEQLVTDLQPHVGACQLTAIGLNQLADSFDLVINATSASLSGQSLSLPPQLHCHAAYEMAYGKPSAFLQQMQARGVPCWDGYSMLVGQAIEAYAVWHGVRPALADFLESSG